jgi:hypothetical protein
MPTTVTWVYHEHNDKGTLPTELQEQGMVDGYYAIGANRQKATEYRLRQNSKGWFITKWDKPGLKDLQIIAGPFDTLEAAQLATELL